MTGLAQGCDGVSAWVLWMSAPAMWWGEQAKGCAWRWRLSRRAGGNKLWGTSNKTYNEMWQKIHPNRRGVELRVWREKEWKGLLWPCWAKWDTHIRTDVFNMAFLLRNLFKCSMFKYKKKRGFGDCTEVKHFGKIDFVLIWKWYQSSHLTVGKKVKRKKKSFLLRFQIWHPLNCACSTVAAPTFTHFVL